MGYVHLSRLKMMAREAGEDPWEGELLFGMEVGGLFSKRSKEMSTQNNNCVLIILKATLRKVSSLPLTHLDRIHALPTGGHVVAK